MSKEEHYNKIKDWVYGKFDNLEVIESEYGDNIHLQYKNDKYAQIRIVKQSGSVYYYYKFGEKICNMIRFDKVDFEILLSRWVEEKFQMKVNETFDFWTVFRISVED